MHATIGREHVARAPLTDLADQIALEDEFDRPESGDFLVELDCQLRERKADQSVLLPDPKAFARWIELRPLGPESLSLDAQGLPARLGIPEHEIVSAIFERDEIGNE